MINKIRNIDFTYIDKISIEKCLELGIIPIKDNEQLVVLCERVDEKLTQFLDLIFDEKIKIEEIEYKNLEKLKNIISLDILGNNIENKVIKEAIELRTSDIHFEPTKKGVYIRLRIDGMLGIKYKISIGSYEKLLSRIKNKSNLDITEKRKPQDGKMNFLSKGKEYNLRISIIRVIDGEKLVIRILRKNVINLDFKELAFSEQEKSLLTRIVKKKDGLVIINGPTGAGKSTTLYSILDSSKELGMNITTIEDPVEVQIDGINQIQLNRDINLDFSNGLKAVLRQDPDIIMIGEIRDPETAKISVRAAMTGHKVYSTVHSISPRETFFRLNDLGIEERTLKEALVGIITQRLLRKLCANCKKQLNESYREVLIYEGTGCEECNYTGYKGRILLSQINAIDRKISLQELYEDINLLNNEKLKKLAFKYLEKGIISYKDYIEFIDEQVEE